MGPRERFAPALARGVPGRRARRKCGLSLLAWAAAIAFGAEHSGRGPRAPVQISDNPSESSPRMGNGRDHGAGVDDCVSSISGATGGTNVAPAFAASEARKRRAARDGGPP